MFRRSLVHFISIAVIAGLFLAWGRSVAAFPNVYSAYDPEFDYMVASLSPFKGETYAYIDHPGTPVEVLGSTFHAVRWLLTPARGNAFVEQELRYPGSFFTIAYAFLILLNLGCVLYFYTTAVAALEYAAWAGGALALMFYALDMGSIRTITYWSHAAFNFPLGTLYLLFLFRIVRSARGEIPDRKLAWLGLGAGLLTSIILYLSAWIVGTMVTLLLLYRFKAVSWRRTAWAALLFSSSATGGFLLAILPIFQRWPIFWSWVLKLVSHQGRFGNGPESLFSVSSSIANLAKFVGQLPVLFAVLGTTVALLLIVAVWRRGSLSENASEWSLVVGLLLQICFLLVIISKSAFYFYLLSVDAVVPVLTLALVSLLRPHALLQRAFAGLLTAFVVIMLAIWLPPNIEFRRAVGDRNAKEHREISNAIRAFSANTGVALDRVTIMWGYGVFEQCNALLDGDYYSGFMFGTELQRVCPNQILIPHGSSWVIKKGHWLRIADVMDESTVIIIRESEAAYLSELLPDARIEELPTSKADSPIVVISRTSKSY